MKIATLTFHNVPNYGAVLQAYSLQRAINKLGHDCTIIDYRCKAIEDAYKPIKIYKFRNPVSYIKYIHNYKKNVKRTKLFEEFVHLNLKVSANSYKTKESLVDLNDIFDKFICGSDQIWNYNITRNDYTYLLDFVSDIRKKYSYAASFGFEKIDSEFIEDYKILLKDFCKISLRELQGQKIIKELMSIEYPVVLDPTLLLNKEEWNKVASPYEKFKKYILLFLLMETETVLNFVYKLSEVTGFEIIYINLNNPKPNMTNVRNVGPSEWLDLFINADYIVTNSFHGTVFSINFNKEFFVELLPIQIDANSRFESIFKTFNLRSRQIIEGKNNNIDKHIDYEPINKILEYERDKSIAFLRNIVDDTNE